MRINLRAKFTALVIAIVLIMMASIWTLTVRQQALTGKRIADQQREAMLAQMKKRAASIFSFLAANSEAMVIEDYLTLDLFVRKTMQDDDIDFVHIVREGRLVVPMPESGEEPLYKLPRGVEPAGVAMRFDEITGEDNTPLILVSGPIVDESINLKVGEAYIAISKKPVLDSIRASQREIAGIGLQAKETISWAAGGFMVFGAAAAFILVTLVVRPIRRLAEGARRIGEGELDVRVDVSSRDEVGALAKTFNEMTANLKLAQERMVQQEKLEQELKIATQIQQTLCPKTVPEIAGYGFGSFYSSAKEVGGDYYDFIELEQGGGRDAAVPGARRDAASDVGGGARRLGVVVADVSGKGVPGALVMSMTRSIMRSQAFAAVDAADTVKRTNAFLQPDIKRGMFVSVFYGLLDPESGAVDWCSAGHNETLVYRAQTRQIEAVKGKGVALGLAKPTQFDKVIKPVQTNLERGDILIQYTDGVNEAMNAKEELWGMDRFKQAVLDNVGRDAQTLVDKVYERLQAFVAGHPASDDITIVAVKRE